MKRLSKFLGRLFRWAQMQTQKLGAILGLLPWCLFRVFRGLACERKNESWELSKGAVMQWVMLVMICFMVLRGAMSTHWLVYAFAGLTGYNAVKLPAVQSVLGKK